MNFAQILTEIEISAVRSRGPGGQNVNKVSSAAQLYWHVQSSLGVNADEKYRIAHALKTKLNREGQIYLRSDESRDFERNRDRVIEKLHDYLRGALHRPKARKATKPTRASKERKLDSKSRRGQIKKGRQKVDW